MMNKYKGLTEATVKDRNAWNYVRSKRRKKHRFHGIGRKYFVYYLGRMLNNVLAGIKMKNYLIL